MGHRGPKPKSNAERASSADPRRDRMRSELQVTAGAPDAPDWLSERARVHWPQVAAIVEGLGCLAHSDQLALSLLCETLAEYVAARQCVEAAAETNSGEFLLETEAGNLIQHPAVGVKHHAAKALKEWCKEFGLTPAARSRVDAIAGGNDSGGLLGLVAEQYSDREAS